MLNFREGYLEVYAATRTSQNLQVSLEKKNSARALHIFFLHPFTDTAPKRREKCLISRFMEYVNDRSTPIFLSLVYLECGL